MKLLLDTQIALFMVYTPERLSEAGSRNLSDVHNELVFSVVSIWEIAIKQRLNKKDFVVDATAVRRELIQLGCKELSLSSDHAIRTTSIPLLHKDPFDRILLAQALTEGLTLITTDKLLARYKSPVQRV